MALKIKHRDPKITDFKTEDIVINVNTGALFYKTKNKLFKVQGDDLSTAATEFSSLGEDIILAGNLVPSTSGSQDLGSATHAWRDLHVLDESIRFYKKGEGEIGKVQFEKDKGLKVRDKQNNLTIVSASVLVATNAITTKGSITTDSLNTTGGGVTGSIDCGLF